MSSTIRKKKRFFPEEDSYPTNEVSPEMISNPSFGTTATGGNVDMNKLPWMKS